MRKALITCFLLATTLGACTLDSQSPYTGEKIAAACGSSENPCDGSATSTDSGSNSGTVTPSADATTSMSNIAPVSTGKPADGGMSSQSSSSSTEPAPPPPPKKPDGESCDADADCVNAHCLHGICCKGGECCKTAADCPKMGSGGVQFACNEPAKCQGNGGQQIRCENFLCVVDGDIPNDTACTAQHMAKECAPYKPVFCNGMAEQTEPTCPTTCANDTACVAGAHCDAQSHTCVADAADGEACKQDADCASDHCNRNICCKAGDCCTEAATCLGKYGGLPMCVDAASCTGAVKTPVCKAFQCASEESPSPRACDNTVVRECGLYPDSICRAGVAAPCPTTCREGSQCKPNAYCKTTAQGGVCEPRLKDGETCTMSSQCEHACNKGFCCNDTDPNTYCCARDEDCAPLNKTECVADPRSCDATRTVATCTAEHRCRVTTVTDANGCTARPVTCDMTVYKATSARCPTGCGCTNQADCAAGYECNKETTKCVRATMGNQGGMQAPMPTMPTMPMSPATGGAGGAR